MSGPRLASRVTSLKTPATFAIAARAKAMARDGIDVVGFGLGEPDFDTPLPIRQAAIDAMNRGQTHYMPTLGDAETRAVVAEKFASENGIPGLKAEHVGISVGAKHAIYLACHCLVEPGDEVLLPVPSWVSYGPIAELAGGRVIELPTTAAGGFRITPDQLRKAITPRTKVLMLNSPSNPCGTMYTPEELRELARVVAEAARGPAPGLAIITDEIYERIVYGGVRHLSIGSLPDVAERTVTINGLSKTFAMTGWRVGFAACPGEFGARLIKAIDALQGQMTSCIPSFIYPAIREALRHGAADTERMRAEFARRATLIYDRAAAIPGLKCVKPMGAFYLFPDASSFYGRTTPGGKRVTDSATFSEAFLSESHVATVPGVEFGGCGDRHIRLSFACSEQDIEKGMDRLARFTAALK